VGYFALGCLTYITASIALLHWESFQAFKVGFFGFAALNCGLGLLDLMSKLSGAGDLLEPIRTASYQMLTNTEEAGFWRITGGFPEASGFAVAALASLAFAFGYWRVSKSTPVLVLAVLLLGLVLLSTSSTAYVACVLVALPVMIGLALRSLAGRLRHQDAIVLGIVAVCMVVGIGAAALHGGIVEQVGNLIESTLLDKAKSASAQERSYWNSQSIGSFFDTGGLGVGFGSSRASSWAVAVLSQTGMVGSLLFAILLLRFVRPLRLRRGDDVGLVAFYRGARACGLAGIVAVSVSGGNADPGLLFFLSLAVCSACWRRVRVERAAPAGWALAPALPPARRRFIPLPAPRPSWPLP